VLVVESSFAGGSSNSSSTHSHAPRQRVRTAIGRPSEKSRDEEHDEGPQKGRESKDHLDEIADKQGKQCYM
jgi:hypothetical protein